MSNEVKEEVVQPVEAKTETKVVTDKKRFFKHNKNTFNNQFQVDQQESSQKVVQEKEIISFLSKTFQMHQ